MDDTSGDYKNYTTFYLFSSFFKEIYQIFKINRKQRKEHKEELKQINRESIINQLNQFLNRFKGQKFHGGNDHPDYADIKLISILNSFSRSNSFQTLKQQIPALQTWELSMSHILRNNNNPYKYA